MQDDPGWGALALRLLRRAMRAGAFAGATAFAFGFFVFPLFRPSNLAPILGFMLAPAGFLAGALVSLAWNLGRGASRPLVRIGVAALLPVVQWAYLMSPPGMVLRGAVLEANFLPAALQATLAPAGILQVWVVGLPPGEQQHYLRSMEHNLGGPTLGRHGYYAVRFVDTDALAGSRPGAWCRKPLISSSVLPLGLAFRIRPEPAQPAA